MDLPFFLFQMMWRILKERAVLKGRLCPGAPPENGGISLLFFIYFGVQQASQMNIANTKIEWGLKGVDFAREQGVEAAKKRSVHFST